MLLVLLAGGVPAREGVAVTLTRGPYLQQGHFTNQATVVWRTDVSADSWVDYGLTAAYGSTVGGGSGYQHEVTLTGLQPGTSYYYRVRSAGVNLASAVFTSGKAPGTPFRIAMFSDAHEAGAGPVGDRMALFEPDLVLAAGDITDNGTFAELDNNIFTKFADVMRRAPLYWTPGNHDVADGFAACREAFVHPPDELNYWFEYADAQIVSLNAEGLPGPSWLSGALGASSKPWKIVFFHEPARSAAGGHGENSTIRDQYVPIMEQHGVQLALAGHNHYYWRSVPINGVTHLITGRAGNRSRDLGDMPCYSAAGWNGTIAKSFAIADFDGPFLQLRGITENGDQIDEMVLDRACAFSLDGELDAGAIQVASRPGGLTLWAALAGRYLYLATPDAGEGNDHFILLAGASGGVTSLWSWAKSGTVMEYDAFLADENDNLYSGWFAFDGYSVGDLRIARSLTPWCNGGVLEGVVDLQQLFGEIPGVVYLAAAAYATADGGALRPDTQCPEGNGDGHLDAAEFVAVTLADLVAPFLMDGVADHQGYLIADRNGMKLWAAVYDQTLYVATWAAGDGGGPNDHFIFVADVPGAAGAAPWAKAGTVASDLTAKPFLADEGAGSWIAWEHAGSSAIKAAAPSNAGQMEGALDLVEAFGYLPAVLYLAVAPYQTDDGGALFASSQVPAGNDNGDIEAEEFVAVPLAAIRDTNLDGVLDVLDPALGFVVQSVVEEPGGGVCLAWPSVPGHTYLVQGAPTPEQTFEGLTSALDAGQGQFLMSCPHDAGPGAEWQCYRVQVNW